MNDKTTLQSNNNVSQTISTLLMKTIPAAAENSLATQLITFGYQSVFDIMRVGKSRFLRRHKHQFSGHAGEIYDRALSFATQLVHMQREQGLRDGEQLRLKRIAEGKPELPSYADLFPEPWDNFCRPGALEALNSPISYLLELYLFARQIELDSTEGAAMLEQRRPDLAELMLDADNTYQELPALKIVNEVLSYSAANYIDLTEDTGKPVNQVLGETRYPFTLPFSLPTTQITLGLEQKKTSLAKIIQAVNTEIPWFSNNPPPNKQNNILLAGTLLSKEQMALLSQPSPFTQVHLTRPRLRDVYLSGSTTETVTDIVLSAHGYIVPKQTDVSGPEALTYSEIEPAPDSHEFITITCINQDKKPITIKLRGKSVLSYQRIKARLLPFDDTPPYPRQLELSWHDEDNPGLDLSDGPYFGEIKIEVQAWSEKRSILTLTYHFAIASDDIDEDKLLPEATDFFLENYGIPPQQRQKLEEILFFSEQTKGSVEELERAFSHGDYHPTVSSNVQFKNTIFSNGQSHATFPTPYQYGSVYLNSAHPEALDINKTRPRSMTAITEYRFDRLNRLLRLQRWTKLPHDKLDLLLTSAARAEGMANLELNINYNSLRALGLFRYLNNNYNLAAEAFAAFVYQITPFGISSDVPFFDQVFNQPQLFDIPMALDNSEFDYTARRGNDARTVKQICAGLGIASATFQILAQQVCSAFSLPEKRLTRSLDVISAFYRLVMIPRLFKLTAEQGIIIVDILSKIGGFNPLLLAGAPRLSPLGSDGESTTEVDVLDIILAIEEMSSWLSQTKLTPEELSLFIQNQRLPIVATDSSADFFGGIVSSLPENLLTEQDFQGPEIPDIGNWMLKLNELITEDGLVKPFPLVWAQSDDEYLNKIITPIVDALTPPPDDKPLTITALRLIIQQYKTAQDNLVSTAVAKEYGVSRDVVPLLLRWVGSSVTELLEMLNQQSRQYHGHLLHAQQISDELLQIAYNLAMNGALIKQLRLTPQLLFLRLAEPTWLSLSSPKVTDPGQGAPLTLKEVFILSRYRHWVTSSLHTEDKLIEYLAYANNPPVQRNDEDINLDCAELLADILGWEASEVEQACEQFTPTRACNMGQIDWLRRVQALSQQTKLSVSPLREAATISPSSSFDQIQHVGEAVIAATKS
ncbi:Tc toxin subunit A [Photorhabdus sp. CRCIA-P01]|uniref:Tc toxin subunit A n=1 Tax=Photorhabdus sp. CRCIA-P01 TaxID=2019570 RepID=UPI000E59AF7C|nr:Tc toxin subunit A [Photorhabdus sp. CRCIA-P01]